MTDQPAGDTAHAERLARALSGSHDGFWERNLRTGQSWYSDSFRALFGFASIDELPNDREVVNARIHRDDIGPFLAAYDNALRTLQPFSYALRFLDKQRRWRWVRGRGRVWPGADGKAEIIAGAASDTTDERQALQQLGAMTDRLEHAVEATGAGLFDRFIDDDEMTYVSERLWALLGYAPGELPPRRSIFIELVHPDEREGYLRAAQQAMATLGRLSAVGRMRCKSGEYRWFRQDAQLHRLPDGRTRITGVLADIHEQVLAREGLERQREQLEAAVAERTARLEAALAQAEARREEADRANAAKSRFLAHMSHEIRTPLNGLLGLTDLALRVAESPSQRRHLEVALQSGQALLQVIGDVLEASRADTDAPAPADAPFDLADALAEVLRGVMPSARDKGLAWRYDWIGERTWVRGDSGRVRQIVGNLLGNAAKFTDAGHITLRTEMVEAGPGRCVATVQVEDTGPGLDGALAARIFDAFVQGDASLSRRHGGTGLGLAIARRLARGLGGDITVRSAPGAGSIFTVTLPLASADDPRPRPAPAAAGSAWLLYEDPALATWVTRRLDRLGWHSTALPSVAAAVEHARRGAAPPQLVLVPEPALTRDADLHALRAALPASPITLVVRPGWNDPPQERAALALGMSLAIAPLTPRDLALFGSARPAAVTAALAPAGVASADGHVLLVEDNPVNRLIGIEILKSLGVQVMTADHGEAALAACENQAPALVLMDLQMPVMDGLEATRRLRALQVDGRLPKFPIVALTAHAMDGDREQAFAAGIDAYLTKPILLEALRGELARWLPTMKQAA